MTVFKKIQTGLLLVAALWLPLRQLCGLAVFMTHRAEMTQRCENRFSRPGCQGRCQLNKLMKPAPDKPLRQTLPADWQLELRATAPAPASLHQPVLAAVPGGKQWPPAQRLVSQQVCLPRHKPPMA